MAKYFAYRREIEGVDGKDVVFIVSPSLPTMYFDHDALVVHYSSMDGALREMSRLKFEDPSVKIVDKRLSFFSLATTFGIEGKVNRMPLGLLERFGK